MPPPKFVVPALAAALALSTAACSVESLADRGQIEIVVGYQSKTINTVTAGTLLRAQGYFEKELDELGKSTGDKYSVRWQDYDTGAPITAEMIAGKIDIGSMGDYPMLINGSRSRDGGQAPTSMLSVTGYDTAGSLNGIVVPEDSPLRGVADLAGKKVSASVGSAGHGLLLRALHDAGVDPGAVSVQNQQPQIGASGLQSKQVDALSQFVAWPGLLVRQGGTRLLYNGAESATPTLHGVVVSNSFKDQHSDVTQAFLRAQLEASDFLKDKPLEAATIVGEAADLPPEVVYLYNGPSGTAFDPLLRRDLVDQLAADFPYLESIGEFPDLDLAEFVDPGPLSAVYESEGRDFTDEPEKSADWSPIPPADSGCADNAEPGGAEDAHAAGAGEVWVDGEDATTSASTPDCLLGVLAQLHRDGKTVRAAYVLDHDNGARWYAEHSAWVRDGRRHLPFSTEAEADEFVADHPGTEIVDFDTALKEVSA